jgi:hypothetical protein
MNQLGSSDALFLCLPLKPNTLRYIRGKFYNFKWMAIRVEDRVVGTLDPDNFATFADSFIDAFQASRDE